MCDEQAELGADRGRELLARERARIESGLADLENMIGGEVEEIDADTTPEDDAGLIEDETVDSALAAQLRWQRDALERAEQRLKEGTYGLSVESGEPIPAARLEAVPWAERTASEQERYERIHGRPY